MEGQLRCIWLVLEIRFAVLSDTVREDEKILSDVRRRLDIFPGPAGVCNWGNCRGAEVICENVYKYGREPQR
jgi:hypothetical protein